MASNIGTMGVDVSRGGRKDKGKPEQLGGPLESRGKSRPVRGKPDTPGKPEKDKGK